MKISEPLQFTTLYDALIRQIKQIVKGTNKVTSGNKKKLVLMRYFHCPELVKCQIAHFVKAY